MISTNLMVVVSCGGFEARQHPDEFFQDGRSISNINQLNGYINSTANNPRFRKAKVTTHSTALRLKVMARSSAASPSSEPIEVAQGEEVDVYWPTDIVNNHIKIFVSNKTLWVTYKSSSGRRYVTLIEDVFMPLVSAPGSTFVPSSGFSNKPPVASTAKLNITPINLPGSAITEARAAIRAVNLSAAEVRACQFNPLVGNNSGSNSCYNKIVISQDFRKFVASYGHLCAQQAARSAFGRSPVKILFHSSYAGQVKRNRRVSGSSKKSTHATGQAFDLFAVSLYFSGAPSRRVTLHRDYTNGSSAEEKENHRFYWSYVKCWRSKVQAHSPCNCSTDKSGALTYLDNSAHYNHVHMSLPFCERSRFNVSCV